MYYCLTCNRQHQATEGIRVFRTGFRTLPDGTKLPLGMCDNTCREISKIVLQPITVTC